MYNNYQKEGVILLTDNHVGDMRSLDRAFENVFSFRITSSEMIVETAILGGVDLILLDCDTLGLDLLMICQHLKSDERTKNIPLVILTIQNCNQDEKQIFAFHPVEIFIKPVKLDMVLMRCIQIVANQRAKKEMDAVYRKLQQELEYRETVDLLCKHDLKGPLTSILGYSHVLLEENNITERQRNILNIVEKSGNLLLEMIDNSLDLFKLERDIYPLDLEIFDIMEILKEIVISFSVRVIAKSLAITIANHGDCVEYQEPFFVCGVRTLCYKLFYNLISNAIEAADNGDIVIDISARDDCGMIRIVNPGEVPVDIRDKFFNKYVTSGKKNGTGFHYRTLFNNNLKRE